MEKRVLAINLDSYSDDIRDNLNSLFEYAFVEGLNIVIFSNGIFGKKESASKELEHFTKMIPSVIDTALFLGYKDSFRLSSKDIDTVTRDNLQVVFENHGIIRSFGHNINFINSNFNLGEVDKVLECDSINVFTSMRGSEVSDKSLRYGNSVIYVGPFKNESGCVATELGLERSEDGTLFLSHGLVLGDSTSFKRHTMSKIEIGKDKKNDNKCLTIM